MFLSTNSLPIITHTVTHTYMHKHTDAHTHTHTHWCTHTYTHTHTHTHTITLDGLEKQDRRPGKQEIPHMKMTTWS